MLPELERKRFPLGRAYPPQYEPSSPLQLPLPVQPTRRWTLNIPTQNAATWLPLDITTPSILRLRSLPASGLIPATGVEQIEMHTMQQGEMPQSLQAGNPAFGNLATLGNPGRWWYSVFANIACTLDVELIDSANSIISDGLLNCPRGHTCLVKTDQNTGPATDVVLVQANEMVEKRKVVITNITAVAARINLGATAGNLKGILIPATIGAQLVLDFSQLPLFSIHGFGTGAGTTLSTAIFS